MDQLPILTVLNQTYENTQQLSSFSSANRKHHKDPHISKENRDGRGKMASDRFQYSCGRRIHRRTLNTEIVWAKLIVSSSAA